MAATEYERLGDTETGIVPVRKQNATTSFYSLSGTKLSQPSRRGIYIKGGKKYLPTKE